MSATASEAVMRIGVDKIMYSTGLPPRHDHLAQVGLVPDSLAAGRGIGG